MGLSPAAPRSAMNPTFAKARRHLTRRDERLKRIIKVVGPCTLQPNTDPFGLLTRSIVSQQISTGAALAIHGRLCEKVGQPMRPRAVLTASVDDLRAVGLSAAKVLSIRDLAQRCLVGEIRIKELADCDDEAV